MYKCVECEAVFEDPEKWEEDRGEFWGVHCTETVCGCPKCRGGFEEASECKRCGEWFFADELDDGYCKCCYDELFK